VKQLMKHKTKRLLQWVRKRFVFPLNNQKRIQSFLEKRNVSPVTTMPRVTLSGVDRTNCIVGIKYGYVIAAFYVDHVISVFDGDANSKR
jgi:hypothetical protein